MPVLIRGLLRVMVGDQITKDLGVGLRLERIALGQQERLDLRVVFDDSVVNQGELTVAADMRVGIAVGDATMSCPARVADARRTVELMPGGLLYQIVDASHLFGDVELAVLKYADPRGIVASILKPLQAFENDCRCFLFTNIANDSTHIFLFLFGENYRPDQR